MISSRPDQNFHLVMQFKDLKKEFGIKMEDIVAENAMFNLMFTVLEQYTETLHSTTMNNILCCHVVDFNPNGTRMARSCCKFCI